MDDPRDAQSTRLDEAVAEYLEAERRGEPPTTESFLAHHADVREPLAAFLADRERFRRMADPVNPLTADFGEPASALPHVRYFGDYELLDEVARGGMGVVYRARQVSLDRTVALKMILRAARATSLDVARFRLEAEAAASLDHPNIVPIYEVGEHEGQQYFAMKFIDGPTLSRASRLPARDEAARLEAVARAVHFAHQRGILHRDLKPGNVLLDAAGRPYVTDFGLAKQLDAAASLTETNAMLGTAGYISPEQARGSRGLTTATDTFSLGAILYERLTGHPAFPGATVMERLNALREGATPRPMALVPGLPRDLETVCLKCLEREPVKRYPTAESLADDLARWLRGEPIAARRTGPSERFALWCRRNPGIAGLSAAVAASLVAGIGASSYFAMQARHEAATARTARDEAEGHLVRSFLKPLGYQANDVNSAERDAFIEMAALTEDRVRIRVLEVALADRDTAFRAARRSERFVQAVVGASETRRRAAIALVSARQRDASADVRVRLAACWLAIELGSDDLPAAAEAMTWSAQKYSSADTCVFLVPDDRLNAAQRATLWPVVLPVVSAFPTADHIALSAALANRLDAVAAARAADALVGVLGTTDDDDAIAAAGSGLAALAGRLDAAGAARAFDALVGVFGKTTDHAALQAAGNSLAVLAGRVDAVAVARAFDALVGVLGKANSRNVMEVVRTGLLTLAGRLDAGGAERGFDALAGILGAAAHSDARLAAASGLVVLAGRVDAERAFGALVGVLGATTDAEVLAETGRGLAALAVRLDAPAAARAFETLVGVLGKPTNWHAAAAAVDGLAASACRLDEKSARAFATLVDALGKSPDGFDSVDEKSRLAALEALAGRLDAPAAARAFDALAGVLGNATDAGALWAAGYGLAALASRLDAAVAARGFDALVGVVGQATDPNALWAAGYGLAALAGRVDAAAAARGFDALVAVLGKADDSFAVQAAASALVALAGRVDAATVARGFDALVGVLGKSTDPTDVQSAGVGLAELAGRVDAAAKAKAFDALVGVLEKSTDRAALAAAGSGLAVLASRLDSSAAARGFDALVGVLGRATDWPALTAAGNGLASLANRLDAATAARAAASLTGLLKGRTDRWIVAATLSGLSPLAETPDHTVREQVCDQLLGVLSRTDDWVVTTAVSDAVLAFASRLDAAKSARYRTRIAQHAVAQLEVALPHVRLKESGDSWTLCVDGLRQELVESSHSGDLTLASLYGYEGSYQTFVWKDLPVAVVLACSRDLPTVARCLTHPCCVGDVRQAVLRRIEALALPPPDGQRQLSVAPSVVSGLAEPSSAGILAAGRAAEWERQRRFRTTWDAVSWLREHHPEIDLDAPYKPQPR